MESHRKSTTQNLLHDYFPKFPINGKWVGISDANQASQSEPLLHPPQLEEGMASSNKAISNGDSSRKKCSVPAHGLFLYLTFTTIILSFVYVVISLEDTSYAWKHSNKNLHLTPFINSGLLKKARRLAKVDLFSARSYSGFLTVDEECKSHLFFWFFPATSGNMSAPLILWHGGGPGTSGLFALFQGTGPILLHDDGKTYTDNPHSVTKSRSVLYLDSPVGTGFSYSDVGAVCYANSTDDVAAGVVEALRQFYKLFPEFQGNNLYLSSSSYGGKFLPTIAWRIDNENQLDALSGDPNLASINLRGIISISGFSDPIHQIDYGEFYYNMGLIDGEQVKHFHTKETLGKSYIRSRKFYEAYQTIDPLIVGKVGEPSLLENLTGIHYPYNFIEDLKKRNATKLMYKQDTFLNLKWVLDSIHVDSTSLSFGKIIFETSSDGVYNNLLSDLYKSVSGTIEDLLNMGKYKFLFTSGQLDLIVPHTTILNFLHELKWDNSFDFKEEGNSKVECNGNVIGYGKSLYNLTYVMFRNAGHHPFIDQPECTTQLIVQFTE